MPIFPIVILCLHNHPGGRGKDSFSLINFVDQFEGAGFSGCGVFGKRRATLHMGQRNRTGSNVSSAGRLCALRLALLVSLSLLACGCGLTQWVHNGFKVGPDYGCPPAAPVAHDWIDSDDARVIPGPPACPDWWSVFQDPSLNGLIQTAYAQNLSLREAGWRVMQARDQRAIAAGNLAATRAADRRQLYKSADTSTFNEQPFLVPLALPKFQLRAFNQLGDWRAT